MLFFEIILQIPYFLTNFAVFNSENRLHLGKKQILFGFFARFNQLSHAQK